jgi:hypothetical protein
MGTLPLEKVFGLLGTDEVAGSKKELKILRIRIGELVELNGEKWVKENRKKLLEEWSFIVSRGIIGS